MKPGGGVGLSQLSLGYTVSPEFFWRLIGEAYREIMTHLILARSSSTLLLAMEWGVYPVSWAKSFLFFTSMAYRSAYNQTNPTIVLIQFSFLLFCLMNPEFLIMLLEIPMLNYKDLELAHQFYINFTEKSFQLLKIPIESYYFCLIKFLGFPHSNSPMNFNP